VLQTTRQLSDPGVATLSHAAAPLAGGAGHAVHDVAPQELTLVLGTQAPVPAGQRWYPGLHAVPHALAVQVASALGSEGVGHVMHDVAVPHCSVLSSGKQPLVAGQVWVPAPHETPHMAFTHAVPVGHGVQSTPFIVPHVSDELLLTQTPLQRCQPVLHAGTHDPDALQVTLPLSGAVQATQLLPHELMLVLLLTTQVVLAPVPHTW
jgi:hypothetical protein